MCAKILPMIPFGIVLSPVKALIKMPMTTIDRIEIMLSANFKCIFIPFTLITKLAYIMMENKIDGMFGNRVTNRKPSGS